jgi:uncharacterized OB-fold protein
MSEAPAKPIPEITPEMAPFWAAARERRLVVQRCTACGHLRFPARAVCSTCWSREAEWAPVCGRGKVFSVVVMHQAADPAFAAVAPYAVAVVALEEGVHLLSGIVGCGAHDVEIGMAVEVAFEPRGPELLLPVFRPTASSGAAR